MSRAIMVLCDGLRDDVAREQMGYLEHLIEAKAGTRYSVLTVLPSVSRTSIETLHTGVDASEHGVTSNKVNRKSYMPNLFEICVNSGKSTAAVAQARVSELYVQSPFDPVRDCDIQSESSPIQVGRFYLSHAYPDEEVFSNAGNVVSRFNPSYLLVHPISADFIGHQHGGESHEYRQAAMRQDQILASYLPMWRQLGYTVFVTADHGMSASGSHGGTTADVRRVPLYIFSSRDQGTGDTKETVSQLRVAPTLCEIIGVERPETMRNACLSFLKVENEPVNT